MTRAPFHSGEAALQSATGARERMEVLGTKMIRDFMAEQHRELFEKLPTIFVGALDASGQPWATMLHGPAGFVRTPDPHTLRISVHPSADDPARVALGVGQPVGLLGLEPHTRRRNRANGVVTTNDAQAWSVRVLQSYGNCPKYIHGRTPELRPDRVAEPPRAEGATLSGEARALIARSDTIFLASSSAGRLTASELEHAPGAGADVSHRGGRAGFVLVEREGDADRLLVPDYAGNSMFNTLGNLLAWPRAGVLFVDPSEGHVLQLAASAEVQLGGSRLMAFPGALRLLSLRVEHGWLRRSAIPLSWSAPEAPQQLR